MPVSGLDPGKINRLTAGRYRRMLRLVKGRIAMAVMGASLTPIECPKRQPPVCLSQVCPPLYFP
jgi:hypothetical protein